MFYILRHGRTDWNEEHRLQGEVDIPLNETGRQMAYDAAEKYKDIDFDICYCSPLKRAQETARIFLADRNPAVEIITDNRLHEMCFGDYEGVKNIRQKPECPVYLLFEEPEKYVAKDGAESFEELYHRTGEFIEQVLRPQLEAGKNVLCEKAFTVNADQARKLFALAKEKNLLITEAIWTRYMPSRKMIDDIISSGVIGEVTAVIANLNYAISEVERIRKPELAGGALLDVGVYTINFASMVLGDKLKDVQATAIFREGVDMLDTIAMVFEGDRMATLQCGAREISDRMGSIFGTKGYIQVQNINNPEKITVFDKEHKEVAVYLPPAQITGYEYEVEACARAIAQGEKECLEMPHDETVRVMGIMDGIRKSWGYEIPLYE